MDAISDHYSMVSIIALIIMTLSFFFLMFIGVVSNAHHITILSMVIITIIGLRCISYAIIGFIIFCLVYDVFTKIE